MSSIAGSDMEKVMEDTLPPLTQKEIDSEISLLWQLVEAGYLDIEAVKKQQEVLCLKLATLN